MVKLRAIIILMLSQQYTYALDDSSFAKGWYWGQDNKIEQSTIENPANPVKTIIKPSITNLEVLNEIKGKIDEAKATAVLNPTVANVANYLRMQNQAVNMASNFSATWQKVQLAYPELDYSASNPSNNYARQLINEDDRANIEQSVLEFAKTNGILFFFNGKDKIAGYQSKTLKEFCAKYNIAIIPIAMDGMANQYFPNVARDLGQAKKLNITITPALIALNVATKQTAPIAYGVLTELELKSKIHSFVRGNL